MIGLRFSNVMEPDDYAGFPDFDADPAPQWNLWGYIDARDGAQAVRLALAHAGAPGVDIFIIANADTVMSRPSAELAAEVFPDVPVRRELGRPRDAAVHRQGPPRARLRARAQLAAAPPAG